MKRDKAGSPSTIRKNMWLLDHYCITVFKGQRLWFHKNNNPLRFLLNPIIGKSRRKKEMRAKRNRLYWEQTKGLGKMEGIRITVPLLTQQEKIVPEIIQVLCEPLKAEDLPADYRAEETREDIVVSPSVPAAPLILAADHQCDALRYHISSISPAVPWSGFRVKP